MQECTSVEESAQNQQTKSIHIWGEKKFGLDDASMPVKCEAKRVKNSPFLDFCETHVFLLCQFSNTLIGWCGDQKTIELHTTGVNNTTERTLIILRTVTGNMLDRNM
jgi:hypothetical protein